jgi:ABC-type branched-subunit amino acid transport system substrate-binding protein/DNA-binding SARP family transcriptional activator/DNA-binding beta-propeller fold protein YncE
LQLKVFLAGRVSVETDGVVIDDARFSGRQGRLLFAYLVAEQGRPVPRDELAEALWGEAPPATWEKALTVIVSKLRALLTDSGIGGVHALTGAFGCYRLDLPEGTWVDVIVAANAAQEAEETLAAGDPEQAKDAAAQAASLVRQPFLPGEDGTWVEKKRRELADVHSRSLTVLAEACLRLGDPPEAAKWAEQAIAHEPFRETGYRRLMEAHAAAGNRAEALRVYERCRLLLAEELGAYPSPETESVYRGLLEAPAAQTGAATAAEALPHDAALQAPPPRLAVSPRLVSQPRRIAIACALLLTAAAAAAGWKLASDSGGHTDSPASAVVVLNPRTGHIETRVPSTQTSASLAVGPGSLWALSTGNRTISRIDPTTKKVVQTFTTSGIPTDLAVGAGALWVENGRATGGSSLMGIVVPHSVSRLDLRSAVPTNVIALPAAASPPTAGFTRATGSSALAIGRGALWAIDADGDVARISPTTRKVIAIVKGLDVQAIAASGSSVWVDDGVSMLARIDPRTNHIATRIPLTASELDSIAIGAGAVWVADQQDGTVWRVVPGPHPVTRTISVGIGVLSLSFGADALWAANPFLGTISRIDPITYTVHTVGVGGTPQALAIRDGAVWTSINAVPTGPLEDGVQALPPPACGPVVSGGGSVQFLIVSDLPLRGSASATVPMTNAIAFVLQRDGFRAGRYAVGYQSCDDSTAQAGNFDFATCGANARAYAADKDVLGVIGTYNSECAVAELPITSGTPSGPLAMISPLDTYTELTHNAPGFTPGLLGLLYPTGKRNFVRIIAPDDVEGAADAKLAHELRLGRVYVLDDESGYGRHLTGGFVHAARKLGLKLAGVSPWNAKSKSNSGLVDRIRRSGADGVFFAGYSDSGTGRLLHELRARLKPRLKLIAPDGFLTIPALIHMAGAAANGMYVSFTGRPNERLPAAGRAFVNAFASTQPSPHLTSYSAAYAAQATEILLAAIARSDATRASVTKQLFASKVSDGILGSFAFTPGGDMTPSPVTIFRVVGGNRPSSTYEQDFAGAVVDRVVNVASALAR